MEFGLTQHIIFHFLINTNKVCTLSQQFELLRCLSIDKLRSKFFIIEFEILHFLQRILICQGKCEKFYEFDSIRSFKAFRRYQAKILALLSGFALIRQNEPLKIYPNQLSGYKKKHNRRLLVIQHHSSTSLSALV